MTQQQKNVSVQQQREVEALKGSLFTAERKFKRTRQIDRFAAQQRKKGLYSAPNHSRLQTSFLSAT